MAPLILALFLVSYATGCEIPFNNKTGIPFSIDFEAPYVSGFDVDDKGDFYFSGADSIIRKISGKDKKIIFTTYLKGLRDGQIGLIGENLWVASKENRSAVRLISLNSNTGEIKSDTLLTFDRTLGVVNNGHFVDKKIIFDFSFAASTHLTAKYVKIDLVSKKFQQINNKYDINLVPDSLVYKLPTYHGRLDSVMIFSTLAGNGKAGKQVAKLILVDKEGMIVGKKDFHFENSEMLLPSTDVSHVRMVAGKVYFLRKKFKENKAKVLSVDLRSITTSEPGATAP